MSLENLQRFKEVVLNDPNLKEQFRATQGRDNLIELTVRLGAEQGFEFTAAEVERALQEATQRIADEPQLLLELSENRAEYA